MSSCLYKYTMSFVEAVVKKYFFMCLKTTLRCFYIDSVICLDSNGSKSLYSARNADENRNEHRRKKWIGLVTK
jgi:hypothetical protein